MASRIAFSLAVAAVVAVFVVGGLRSRGPKPRPDVHDVILVSIDTLRADHLGCYGYGAPTSPHIDAFRRDAVLFRQTIAAAPSTLPAHASMMTSLLPQQHGAEFWRNRGIAPGIETLASIFRDHGYRTASWNDGGQIAAGYGIERGFDEYWSNPSDDRHFSIEVAAALASLNTHAAPRQFLFLHTYELHHPYLPDPRYLALMEPPYKGPLPWGQTPMSVLLALRAHEMTIGPRDLQHIVATYDGGIRSMDEAFGQLILWLKQHDRYNDSLIVLTADHGEEFGEHGTVGWHSHTLFDELLLVPLLIKFPDNRLGGTAVDDQVRQIDIAPTLLGAVGWVKPGQFRGADLAPLLEAKREGPRFAVSKMDSVDQYSIRYGSWKLYGRALYDLAEDPRETRNVAPKHPDMVSFLSGHLKELVEERPVAHLPKTAEPPVDAARLRALGYVKP
jgi:arylsulfatase A-like enzyme